MALTDASTPTGVIDLDQVEAFLARSPSWSDHRALSDEHQAALKHLRGLVREVRSLRPQVEIAEAREARRQREAGQWVLCRGSLELVQSDGAVTTCPVCRRHVLLEDTDWRPEGMPGPWSQIESHRVWVDRPYRAPRHPAACLDEDGVVEDCVCGIEAREPF